MKKVLMGVIVVSAALLSLQSCNQSKQPSAKNPLTINFDSKYEVAGQKFSVQDLGLENSGTWDKYNYLVLEMKASSPQRFQVGFNTSWGYNELRMMPYSVGEWSRVCIPLRLFREKPRPSHDIASLNNIPFVMAWYNLGDNERGPIVNVDSIGIRMYGPIDNPTLEIRSMYLSTEDVGDKYFGETALIDEFGQWNLGDYEGKIHSLEELQNAWKEDDKNLISGDYKYSKFGGYLNAKIDNGTGFFRVKRIDGRWWFVDPEGHLFLSVGVDCVNPDIGTTAKMIDERDGVYKEIPPKEIGKYKNNNSFGIWNLARRYGEDKMMEEWQKKTIQRMDKWGINTIANWSSKNIVNTNKKPFMLQLDNLTPNKDVFGLQNVYAPGFADYVEEAVKKQVTEYKNNPWLIGWFVANEPAWLDQEEQLIDIIKENGDEYFKAALNDHMKQGDTPEIRRQFAYNTLNKYLQIVKTALKKYDPHHLNLGLRFGHVSVPSDEILAISKDIFDVYSFNSYSLTPNKEYLDIVSEKSGLPMIIGEFHFGTSDRGMSQSLWQVDDQKERGVAYRYYVENAYSHPALIGTAYFQWSDQSTTGRELDGENYNCGLVDVLDLPYPHQIEAMMESSKRLYDVHMGKTEPFSQVAKGAKGPGLIPDLWNK